MILEKRDSVMSGIQEIDLCQVNMHVLAEYFDTCQSSLSYTAL